MGHELGVDWAQEAVYVSEIGVSNNSLHFADSRYLPSLGYVPGLYTNVL